MSNYEPFPLIPNSLGVNNLKCRETTTPTLDGRSWHVCDDHGHGFSVTVSGRSFGSVGYDRRGACLTNDDMQPIIGAAIGEALATMDETPEKEKDVPVDVRPEHFYAAYHSFGHIKEGTFDFDLEFRDVKDFPDRDAKTWRVQQKGPNAQEWWFRLVMSSGQLQQAGFDRRPAPREVRPAIENALRRKLKELAALGRQPGPNGEEVALRASDF